MSSEFYVKVNTDRDEFDVVSVGNITEVNLTQPAENGRANSELINKLEEVLGTRPGIVSGHKSRRKKLRVDLSKGEIEQKLKNY